MTLMVVIAGNLRKCVRRLSRKKASDCAWCEHGVKYKQDCHEGMDYPRITLDSMEAAE